jgi:beta-lactamase superfamily II metal-dependent hydrolase
LLRIHQLDAGKGDSAVIELHPPEGGHFFGVIDSNLLPGQSLPPALSLLRKLKVDELSFVVLTHPHADHYSGLFQILQAYKGKIRSFFTFPLDKATGKLPALTKVAKELAAKVDSDHIAVRNLSELYKILNFATQYLSAEWDDTTSGWDSRYLNLPGLSMYAVLPMKSKRGAFWEAIESGEYDPLIRGVHDNDLSIALRLEYAGREIVLGGDGTYAGWMTRKNAADRSNSPMKADVVKLPHHGSKTDSNAAVLDSLFRGNTIAERRYAIISAEGRKHPADETLKALADRGIFPFCTNLAKQCGAQSDLKVDIPDLSPVAKRDILQMVDETEHQSREPCQGAVTLNVDHAGQIKIDTEHAMLCPYRVEELF